MKNPGIIIELEDGRKAVIRKNQPLKEKVILELLGEDLKPKISPKTKQVMRLIYGKRSPEIPKYKVIGYID